MHEKLGLTGEGVTIAILDSGVDTTHPDLGGAVVAQHCFTHGGCEPGTDGGPDEGEIAFDDTGHGTHIAGVIASRGLISSHGMAPGAQLIAVRVLSDNQGRMSDWLAALDWLIDRFDVRPFEILNMSLGTSELYPWSCDESQQAMAVALAELEALGVSVFASSGNDGSSTSTPSPACNSDAIAVTASYDASWERLPESGTFANALGSEFADCFDAPATPETIACFANVGPQVRLAGPGALIVGPVPFAQDPLGSRTLAGTSQAAPVASAVAALILEQHGPMPSEVLHDLLAASGDPIVDWRSGRVLTRIDARIAVGSAQCLLALDGTACNDTDDCSQEDACIAERCTAGPPARDGMPCSDGNACTESDACMSGTCGGGKPMECAATRACRAGAFCRVGDGSCGEQKAAEGALCDDGDACTHHDFCSLGDCLGTPNCPEPDECIALWTCDPLLGACASLPREDGTACSEGECVSGECRDLDALPDEQAPATQGGGCRCGLDAREPCVASPGGRAPGACVLLASFLAGLARARRRSKLVTRGRRGGSSGFSRNR